MKKRFLLVFLALCLVMALLPMAALADGDTYGTDAVWAKNLTTLANEVTNWTAAGNYDITWHTGGSPYHITDAADLAGLAVLVNGLNGETATDFSGEQIILDQDINLSAHSWKPIGTVVEIDNEDVYYAFKGIFDGNDKAITGLNVPCRDGYDYAGLFGYTDKAEIRNLTITDCSVMGGMYIGSLVGCAQDTVIQNCQASGTVYSYNNVGGLAAYAGGATPTIAHCSFTGTVISGHGTMAGGLVGESSCHIEDCFAAARVSGYRDTGGLVGRNSGTISGSYATGDAYAGYGDCGGLVGQDEGTITGSYATGNVYAAYDAGGLVGDASSEITDCYATGDVYSQWSYAGGLAGYNYGGLISSGYAAGDVTSRQYGAGGIVGYNAGAVTNCTALCKNVTGLIAGEIIAANYSANGTFTNDWYLSGMNLTGDSVDFDDTGVQVITPEMEKSPAFYRDSMHWVFYDADPAGVWYYVPFDPGDPDSVGTYPQLRPITEATVTIEGTGFSVYADGKPINSGDQIFTGTKLELRSSREGYAVNSFVLEYEELEPLVESSTQYESVSGNSFVVRYNVTNVTNVTIQDVTDEDQVVHAGQGDIWVYDNYYVIWGSQDLNNDKKIDLNDFAIRYAEAEDFYAAARPMDPGHPITSYGVPINQNLYQIDDGMLYLGNLNLGSGGFYGFDDDQEINFESGTLRAAEIDLPCGLWLETGTTTIVTGDITAGDEVYSYGCNLEVGGDLTTGDDVYFDSDNGPLFVTVHGDIITASSYGQEGGSVRVDGNVVVNGYEDEDNGKIYCDIYCGDDYAHYNATELFVGGDLIARHEVQLHLDQVEGETIQLGNVVIGEENEINTGSLDTASNDSTSRHSKKTASDGDEIATLDSAGSSEPLTDLAELDLVTVRVGGSIIAGREIEIYGGDVKVANTIQTLSEQEAKTIYIYGGKIKTGGIISATDIFIDQSGNDNADGSNDPIKLHVIGSMIARCGIDIESGRVDVDGDICALAQETGDCMYIKGGTVTADNIISAANLVIGTEVQISQSGSDKLSVTAADTLGTGDNLYLYSGMISAAEISFDGTCIIEDAATLLNAENNNTTVAPVNVEIVLHDGTPDQLPLYRTKLSGLIPGALMRIEIQNSAYAANEGIKAFTATADEDGFIYVWLLEGESVSGTAVVRSEEENELKAPAGSIGEDADNELNFGPATAGVTLVKIGLTVPDATYKFSGLPWENDNPYDPANWTFTDLSGATVEGFSGERSAYDCTIYRNGLRYNYEDSPSLLAGDYTVYVSTTQDIIDGESTTTYVAAGSASFKISPAVVTAKADDKTVTVGDALPEFTMNFDGTSVLEGNDEEDYLDLFYNACFGTTAVRGSYPIYTRMNCTGDDSELYASYLHEIIDLEDSFVFDIQNGVLTVRSATSGSGGSLLTYYAITATAGTGGSITPSGSVSVVSGADKTFTIKADTGYQIADVLVNGKSVGAVATYTIKNISKDTTIEAKFAASDAVVNPFSDVPVGSWYYDAVNFVAQKGLFKGTSDTTFEPNAPVTRAMFVTTLGRLHEVDQSAYAGSSFSDVPTGEWYSAYVTWAAKNGIAKGYSDGTFGPDDEITREELCAILSRYCDYAGIKLPQTAAPADFADSKQVQDWAKNYVKTVQMADLVRGMENNMFQPQGDADRAQVAMILMRLILNVIEA